MTKYFFSSDFNEYFFGYESDDFKNHTISIFKKNKYFDENKFSKNV